MIIKHQLNFETVLDEMSDAYLTILTMPESVVKEMFENMLKDLVVPRLEPILDEINEGGSWAILKVVK